MKEYLTRIRNYYESKGFWGTFKRIYEQPSRMIFKSRMNLYYAEVTDSNDSKIELPVGVSIESVTKFSDINQLGMKKVVDYWERNLLIDNSKARFEKGAVLWLVTWNGDTAAFGWSVRGKMVSPFYFPVTANDAIFFDYVTFEEYRGRRIFSMMLDYKSKIVGLEGVTRVFMFAWEWNTSSIRAVEKSRFFRRYAVARKFHAFGRNITIWSQ